VKARIFHLHERLIFGNMRLQVLTTIEKIQLSLCVPLFLKQKTWKRDLHYSDLVFSLYLICLWRKGGKNRAAKTGVLQAVKRWVAGIKLKSINKDFRDE
jgi:hypothetical protein